MAPISFADRERLVRALSEQALGAPQGPTHYYRSLVAAADLPPQFRGQIAGAWSGDATADARSLVNWASVKGVNPADPRYATLGSLLLPFLEGVGADQRAETVALIVVHRLVRDDSLLTHFRARYQVPTAAGPAPVPEVDVLSPPVALREPLGELELQGLLTRDPDLLDIGFLSRAIDTAVGICRIETSSGQPLGTGFLAGPRAVLTNCHVVAAAPGETLTTKAQGLVARFGSITAGDGREASGQRHRVTREDPLLSSSPPDHLDYALLHLEQSVTEAADLHPLAFNGSARPARGMPLIMLGHPQGGPMQLALSGNGVVGVYADTSRIQYVARAERGSSGSPCFDEDWRLVALHHAERSRTFGSVREGILMQPIYDEIRALI